MDDNAIDYVNIINEYYTNLEYDINKKVSLKRISDLSLGLKFQDVNNFAVRLDEAVSIIQDNVLLFASVCEHKDVLTSIIDYLNYFGVQFMYDIKGEFNDKYETIMSLMLTICNISKEPEVQLFLENAIIKDSEAQNCTQENCKSLFPSQYIEMVLLEESDLYAFINCLKMKNVASSLHKIWVQQSIKQTFQWHIKKYFGHLNVPIHIFQSQQELLNLLSQIPYFGLKILSIWSEDIVGARNLAMSLQRHVVFINTHMNFCAGILLPYAKLLDRTFQFLSEDEYMSEKHNYKWIINPKSYKGSIYNLFYNNIWQKPVRNMYWEHNDMLLANATCEDFTRCIKSAEEGYKIWSAKSINSRMHVLSKLASILKYKNESLLADVVSKWKKLPYFCVNLLTCHETEQFEITKIRIPKGVSILEEKDKVTLFRELTQCLITGNSIIVICNADLCTLAPYCDIFLTATIPPGVINLLSSNILVDVKYDNLAELKPEEVYVQLTINKHIVLCLK
ncbi:unnamed protein product [Lasius platythorax]|uniref:Uncharacterized protein n=1 Tax=Lasius platythorax TaxID=488582 RepID=A0AAV2PA05_9HYME